MTIDLKYTLPFALPFVFLALFRVLAWAAGAQWSEPTIAVVWAVLFGQAVGWVFIFNMNDNGKSWEISIPRPARKGGEQ